MAIKKPDTLPLDEINKTENNCSWCNYDGIGEDGLKHEKVKDKYFVRDIQRGYVQCDNCGKTFEKQFLGKPWSLDVERGSLWARENRIKELGGRT